jgi:photosystem II stability/assembly factor-like uncharacterized protein
VKSVRRKLARSLIVVATSTVVVLLIALLPISSAQAAGTWSKTRPLNVESDLNGTFFLPAPLQGNGWAVGRPYFSGAALNHCWYTSDGGTTWTPQTVGNWGSIPTLMFAEYESVYFRNINQGWACGQMGFISLCTNGATGAWQVVRAGTQYEVLNDIFATSATEVWASGMTYTNIADPTTYSPLVLKSEDGGVSWHKIDIKSISFFNTQNGWAVGDGGAIIHTSDGGSTWELQGSTVTANLNAVKALSSMEAWAAGDAGVIIRTIDGGTTWSRDFGANDVFMLDTSHIWVVGQDGLVMFCDGSSWTLQNSGYTDDLNAVQFINANYGWAVGAGGRAIYTTNGGAAWTALGGIGDDLNDVFVYDDSGGSGDYLVWTCGDGGAFNYTSDAATGGAPAAWSTPATTPPAEELFGVQFSSASDGWVAGSNGTLAFTANGGVDWDNTRAPAGVDFTDVAFTGSAGKWFATAADGGMWQTRKGNTPATCDWGKVDLNDAICLASDSFYTVGGGGAIIKRSASTYAVQDSTTSKDLYGCDNRGLNYVWASGDNAVVYTRDGGTNWSDDTPATSAKWNDVSVAYDGGTSTYYICTVGSGGNILHATDDGSTVNPWATPTSTPGGSPDLNAVDFMSKDVGYAAGAGGAIWTTGDGSAASPTWTAETSGTSSDLYDISAVDVGHIWAVGQGGVIRFWNGSAWVSQTSGTTNDLYAVYGYDDTHAWAVGANGTRLRYDGSAWSSVATAAGNDLFGLSFMGTSDGIAVGEGRFIESTNDGADNWTPISGIAPTLSDFLAVDFADAGNGEACGQDAMTYKYTNGLITRHTTAGAGELRGVSLYDDSGTIKGYMVGQDRQVLRGDGTNWYLASSSLTAEDLRGLSMPVSGKGWFAGTNNEVIRYNGGVFEHQAVGGPAVDYSSISMLQTGTGAMAGDGGVVRYTSDGGMNWFYASNVGTSENINSVQMQSATSALLCGDGGVVRRSTDGGQNWNAAITTPPSATGDLNAVAFADANNTWIVGDTGAVFGSTDAGDNWTTQTGTVRQDLSSVDAQYDSGSGDYLLFAAGATRTIVMSEDGGESWDTLSAIPRPGALTAGSAVDADNIFFCGVDVAAPGGMVVFSNDHGATFTASPDGGIPVLYDIECYDATHIWAVGDSGFIFFFNGAAWSPQAGAAANLKDIDVDLVGGNYHGVAVGAGGAIYFTAGADAGGWAAATTPNVNDLFGVSLRDFGGPSAVCHAAGDAGTIMGSANSGASWTYEKGPANTLYGTSFYDADNGWACGSKGTILRTVNGTTTPVTWTTETSGTSTDLYAVAAVASNNAWAVGASGKVLFWNGAAWTDRSPGTANDLFGVCADATRAWVVGEAGTIKYWDGSWHDQDTGTADLKSVSMADATHMWAAGTGGAVLSGDGSTWTPQDSSVTSDLLSISAADTTDAWACGAGGVMVHTSNAGTDWSEQTTGAGADLNAVKFTDSENGWAVGAFPVSLQPAIAVRTADGGQSWTTENSATGITRTLRAIDGNYDPVSKNYVMFAVGDWGLAQRQVNATAVPVITPPLVPTSGDVGSSVTINGTDFGADQVAVGGHVYFNGTTEGSVTSWSDTQIQVTVPATAYGNAKAVRVVNSGGGSNSAPFTVNVQITNATPNPMTGGNTVTITGSGFGPDPGAGNRGSVADNVTLAGTLLPDANVTSWSESQIQFTVPDTINPSTGWTLQVTRGGSSGTRSVTVRPNLTLINPTHGKPGDSVTITGTNFGINPTGAGWDADNCVKMQNMDGGGGLAATMIPEAFRTAWSNTSITFTIPDSGFNPWTGAVSVIRGQAESTSNPTLTVEPLITGLPVTSGTVGSSVTVNGFAFGADKPAAGGHIFFNGVEAATTGWQYDQVTATVPETVRGPVTVTTSFGTSNDNYVFSVVPNVGSLSRSDGRVGDSVVITGTGFGATKGASTVSFNGSGAATTAWSATSITATVPAGATSGPIVVTTTGGSSGGTGFTVKPKITGIDPAAVMPGVTEVTISGYTFGATQAGSTVTFNGVDAGAAISWSDTGIKIKAPLGCTSGDILVTTTMGSSNGFAFSVGPHIDAVSPTHGPPTGPVTITGNNFKATQGASQVKFNGVDAGVADSWSNTLIKVKTPYGAETGPVTVTTAEGTSNTVTFEVGLSNTYYFAEGTTRPNFEEWLCLMNPNDKPTLVDITYMLGNGTTKPQQVLVKATSRLTLFVPDAVGANQDVSTKVVSQLPIMAERPMYFNYKGVWTGGHDVVGAIAPAQDWYFAEGNTRDGFEEWLCLQNPGTSPATVQITYMLAGGDNRTQDITIPATSRETVDVKGFLGPNIDCSAKVHSNVGIIAERPMYFIYKPGVENWTGGHDVVGANAPGKEWYFAEGTTREGFDEWLCLLNPGDTAASVTIEYMLASGQVLTQSDTVTSHSRKTIDVVAFVGRGQDCSVHITSDKAIVAERPMYFDYVGLTGGSDVIGATCSSPNWYFAEGATQNGFQEWLSIQNPGNTDATVNITYMLGKGAPINKSITVKAHSRATVDVNSDVGWGKDVSTKITTGGQGVIVERPMYFDLHGWTGGHDVVGFHF